jgi:branched-chain amino acid transport system ATP-binding protein
MLKVEGLSVSYGPVQALDGVSIEVAKGESVALVGVNGAGKTTLLRAISGLVRERAGAIRYEGQALGRLAPESRVAAGLAHVPERRRIFPGLSVQENLRVATTGWRRGSGSLAAELDHVFALFPRLAERRGQLGWSLSGGEQQMLAIGRALMARPKLILMDEPSLGLAPLLADEVYQKIRAINRDGVTVLLVEQNTVLALSTAARGYVLEHGRIVLAGKSEDLIRNPRVREAYLGR